MSWREHRPTLHPLRVADRYIPPTSTLPSQVCSQIPLHLLFSARSWWCFFKVKNIKLQLLRKMWWVIGSMWGCSLANNNCVVLEVITNEYSGAQNKRSPLWPIITRGLYIYSELEICCFHEKYRCVFSLNSAGEGNLFGVVYSDRYSTCHRTAPLMKTCICATKLPIIRTYYGA